MSTHKITRTSIIIAVAVIVIGLTVSTIIALSSQPELSGPPTAGTLGSEIDAPVASPGPNAAIGELVTQQNIALFDGPSGITIGRISPGTYPVLDTHAGWVKVSVEKDRKSQAYGWITLAENVQLNMDEGQTTNR